MFFYVFSFRYLQNCSSPSAQFWFSVLWVFILVLLLNLLASTAESYFCSVMDNVVEKLHIPPSIAGVTFLAFGNGSPDVFSLIISVLSGLTEIGVGANIGAGVFVSTVVAGLVSFVSVCEINRRAFLRDIIFYIIAVVYLVCVFFDTRIKLWEAIGFVVLYLVYISIVLFSPKKKKNQPPPPPVVRIPGCGHVD